MTGAATPIDFPRECPPTDGLITLRQWRSADIPAIVLGCVDPETQRWTLIPQSYTERHAEAFVAEAEQRRLKGDALELAVAETSSDVVLGAIALMNISWQHQRAEIGYWTSPKSRNSGVATRAVRLFSSWVFAKLPLGRLEAAPFVGNTRSENVLRNAGYTQEGVLRSFTMTKHGHTDAVVFSLLSDESQGG
jgi:RimJ/RimL family protein N-acetyltransferase